ncbi:MAG TPA: hypothetical protein VFJ47_01910 [Terriglobales bacterium]|nr:hypothetical protein [Terriglobales bacterium]
MARTHDRDWREVSQAASQEQDPEKLLQLVHELNEILQKQEEYRRAMKRNFAA